MRSHPPSLPTLARTVMNGTGLFKPGDVALVAVSGGPDSMALVHVLASLRAKRGYSLVAHGVDHGLRDEAKGELDVAERFCEGLDVPFARTVVSVERGGNLQARAREARYAALDAARAAAGATVVATAHHADDRAETFLIRLLRGSGPAGLAVLPARSVDRVRPFILARRADVMAYVERHRIPFSSDPSNRSVRFVRTRVREKVLPLLADLNPRIVEHLCALADQLAAGRSEDEGAEGTLSGNYLTLPRRTREALQALSRTKSATARVQLPGGLVAALDATQAEEVHLPGSRPSDKSQAPHDDSVPPTPENGHHTTTPFSDPSRRRRSSGERSFP